MNGKGSIASADLRKAGLRGTKQRVALLSLLRASGMPLSIEELVRKGKGEFDTATAYRMLDAFVATRLANRSILSKGRAAYEATDHHHHHAVCRSCARIVDIETCISPALDERVRKAAGFASIDDHALEFFGLCSSCSKKRS